MYYSWLYNIPEPERASGCSSHKEVEHCLSQYPPKPISEEDASGLDTDFTDSGFHWLGDWEKPRPDDFTLRVYKLLRPLLSIPLTRPFMRSLMVALSLPSLFRLTFLSSLNPEKTF